MSTKVIKVKSRDDCSSAVHRASTVLKDGGLVAFPTETVYGVAACVANGEAVERLRKVKQRPTDKAFTVHLGICEDTTKFVIELPELAARFVRRAWPGPLTLIITVDDPSRTPVMTGLNGRAAAAIYYGNSVGLRCPDDPVAEALLRAVETPVVAASANGAQQVPPCSGEDVLKSLDGQIDLLIDAGRTKYAKPSTIVRLTKRSYEVVREGVLDTRTVQRLAGLRLLFVCTGNTCRSPMAAGIAAKLLAERVGCRVSELADRGIMVTSAGTAGGFGRASKHAVTVMRRRGIDISNHVSSALTAPQICEADFTFAMTGAHCDLIRGMVPGVGDRVALLLVDQDVHDPIGGSEEDYEKCAQAVEGGVRAQLQEVSV